ncbi:MAG: hypothetical protein GY899_16400 [Verrucomicrobiaceae bacterium]|nr:hypothetical protein [Verrucomicrobiaceae bacterium]
MKSAAAIVFNIKIPVDYLRFVLLILALSTAFARAQFFNDFDQPPHDYWTAKMNDPMTRLLAEVDKGEKVISEEPGLPLVRRLLKELSIPVESQVLVFSRTSLQRGNVTPANPRAIFFNEDTYLGWMPEGRIEIASSDPKRGSVFFFQRQLDDRRGKLFVRDRVCIQCHAGSATNFLPGLLARSVYPDARGRSLRAVDSFDRVGHHVPLGDRWGGWYVTGGHDALQHMGNAIASRNEGELKLIRNDAVHQAGLGDVFDVSKYPVPTSDVAALLVLDHQVSMHFKLMEAAYIARQAIHDATQAGKRGGIDSQESVIKALNLAARQVVNHLLFADEATIGGESTRGNGVFVKSFLSRRVADSKGRALRDFDLKDRMFRYRCSYMIHSRSFSGLPKALKQSIFRRLHEILASQTPLKDYDYFVPGERSAILEILGDTLPGFKDAL